MPSHGSRKCSHVWTAFEKRILLCLISRGVHIIGIPGSTGFARRTASKRSKLSWNNTRKVHKDFVDAFNRALNGENSDGVDDIDHQEIISMAEKMLYERVAATMMMDRKPGAQRLTRTLRKAWDRGFNFVGTKMEWYFEGRREAWEQEEFDRWDGRFDGRRAKTLIRDKNLGGAWVAVDLKPVLVEPNADIDEDVGLWREADEPWVDSENSSINQDDEELAIDATNATAVATGQGAQAEGVDACGPDTTKASTAAALEQAIVAAEAAEMKAWVEAGLKETGETTPNVYGDFDYAFNDTFQAQGWEDTTMVDTSSDVTEFLEQETAISTSHAIQGLSDKCDLMETMMTPVDIEAEADIGPMESGKTKTGDNALELPFNRLGMLHEVNTA